MSKPKLNADFLLEYLKKLIPEYKAELNYTTVFELLVAVVLSAQCTDVRVNKTTAILFSKYNTARQFAELDVEYLEKLIRPCGLSNTKAKNLIATAKILATQYDGLVPDTLEQLIELPGVGRKSANVILWAGFNIPAIAVDTHVFRVSNRLSIATGNNVNQCERKLMQFFDRSDWGDAHHLLVLFGRYHCKAIKPDCLNCGLKQYCIK